MFHEIIKRIEAMRSIKFFVIFSVTEFYFAVMSWCERSDLFMLDTKFFKRFLEERRRLFLAVPHLICKLKSVICLNAFYDVWELLYYVFQEKGRGICVFFLESLQITKTAIFINNPILKWCLTNTGIQTDRNGNIVHIKNQSPRQRIDNTAALLDCYVGLYEHYNEYTGAI